MADSPEDILLRGVVRVENVENPAQYVPAVLAKCKRHHLERTYDIKISPFTASSSSSASASGELGEDNMVGTPQTDKQKTEEAIRFLEALARKGGRLLKGGEADLDGVAKMVLNDFLRGKVPWFVPPPSEGGDEDGVVMDKSDGDVVDGDEAKGDEGIEFEAFEDEDYGDDAASISESGDDDDGEDEEGQGGVET